MKAGDCCRDHQFLRDELACVGQATAISARQLWA